MLAGHLAVVAQEGSFCDHPTVHRAARRAKSISAPAHKDLPPNWRHRSCQGEPETPLKCL